MDRASITRELEAMKRVGIGGVTMFDVAQGTPPGPNGYLTPGWQDLFAHEIAEAKRLGLETMTQAGPGWTGNGGPWISPELAAQKIVVSETRIPGGRTFSGKLPEPERKGGFYRDVAVFAIHETEAQRTFKLEDFDMKRLNWLSYIGWGGTRSAPLDAAAPAAVCIPREMMVNVTDCMTADGTFKWDAPAGEWTLLRFGHTWTGQQTNPCSKDGMGPEFDKLDKRGVRAHFNHVLKRMVELAGPEAGKSFTAFSVDSWEDGGQNWTEKMPEEFRRRRGYDILPFLSVIAGRVVGDLQTTERFLYDLRQTASELITENFWAELQRLSHERKMKVAAEPYITGGNDFDATNFVDEPMGEFWLYPHSKGLDYLPAIKQVASSANLNGQRIVGAEAFTSSDAERWQAHPATMKALGDQIFCLGANRFQFHRFAMQRFPQIKPGIMMGPWGVHYDSTQTWWEWTKPWHEYLARCQFMLSQGPVVTDLLDVAPEEPLFRFEYDQGCVPGYDFDACGPDSFRQLVVKKNGRTGIAGGPDYALVRVIHHGTMTVARLKKLRDLVAAGANLLADPPQATPGLEGQPQADEELKQIATELWGSTGETERAIGKGRIFRSQDPAAVLAKLDVQPDFSSPEKVTWIHRRAGDADIYFIASASEWSVTASCTLRVSGKRAELWDPETGKTSPLAATPADSARSTVQVPLGPAGSAFVVLTPCKPTQAMAASTPPQPVSVGTFSYAVWAAPKAEIDLPAEATEGISGLNQQRNDAMAPPPGHQLLGEGNACSGLSIGRNGVVVYEHSAFYFAPVLVHATPISDWTHVAVIYQDGVPTLYLNGKQARQGKKGPCLVHSPVRFAAATQSTFLGQLGVFSEFAEALNPEKIAQWIAAHPPAVARMEIRGPWQVTFDSQAGGPSAAESLADKAGSVEFTRLEDWSKRPEEGIRHYSGTATYRNGFTCPQKIANRKYELDLGKVAVMARVKLNGKDLGILWKPPYHVDVTDALRAGENILEIAVVNLWINRLIGDAALPEDAKRNEQGRLDGGWPQWVLEGGTSPTGRRSFVTIAQYKKDDPLVASGLLGPVSLRTVE